MLLYFYYLCLMQNKILFFIGAILIGFSARAQFVESAQTVKIDHAHYSTQLMGGGVVMFDCNGDDLLDIYLTGGIEQDRLYLNEGTGRFIDVTESFGILPFVSDAETFGVIAGDINNDGCQDLFITNFARDQANILLLNNCDSTFTDISAMAGITESFPSTSATFLDFNKDGFLDIYVGNYIDELGYIFDDNGETIGFDHICFPDLLYVNNGDNTFTESGASYGVNNSGCTLATLATDVDLDGDLDLYVANDFGAWVQPNVLYQNNSDQGTFVDISVSSGMDIGLYAMGIAATDFEKDGDLDYYVTNLGKNYFMVNQGNGTFVDKADTLQIDDTFADDGKFTTGWAALFCDIDNDSNPDLFVANGYITAAPFIGNTLFDANVLYKNMNGSFVDISDTANMNSQRINRGAAYGDFDNDGDFDMVVQSVSTAYNPQSTVRTLFYANELSSANSWLQLKLQGVTSNKDAIGALVSVYANGLQYLQELTAGGTHASQNTKVLHYGLAAATTVDSVTVTWPSGSSQVFAQLPVNQKILLTEGDPVYQVMGCTDQSSAAYNPLATYSTGCYVQGVFGCTDPAAINYFAEATVDDGSCLYDVVTAIEATPNDQFKVYPVPFSRQLNIGLTKAETNRQLNIVIEDTNGREVFSGNSTSESTIRINTTGFETGIYFVRVYSNRGHLYTRKIVKF